MIASADQLFAEFGYSKTTIDDIAAAANVSRPTFYLHFSTKFEIVQEISRGFRVGIYDVYRLLAGLGHPTFRQIREWVDGYVRFCEANQRAVSTLLSIAPSEPDAAAVRADVYQHSLEILGGSISAFGAAASGSDPEIRAAALLILLQLESLARLSAEKSPMFDGAALNAAVSKSLFDFIYRYASEESAEESA